MHEAILTIDLGTTACKSVLFSENGRVLASTTMSYPTWRPDFERAEQNPNDWWQAVTSAVRKVLSTARDSHVRAIGLTAQRETIIPVDSGFTPLHSAVLWMDTRGIDFVFELKQKYGEKIREWTGLIPGATYSIGKILWLKQKYPELLKQTRYFLQPKDYLLFRMSGVVATDKTLASRTMLYNTETFDWQGELLEECSITRRQLPEVYASTTAIAGLHPSVASEWGLPPGIPIILGGGDRSCEFLGAGVQDGEAMESTGTTSNISCLIKERKNTPSLFATSSAYVLDGYYLLEQGLSTTGAIIEWLRSTLDQNVELEDLDKLTEKSPPGASGLITLPFFMGARAPRWNPLTSGAMIGLNLSHRKEDILRSVLEGIAYELRFALDNFQEAGAAIDRIRLIGGGAMQHVWNQIKANIYQKQLATLKVTHAASFGAFLLCAHELGWITAFDEGQNLNYINGIYHPDLKLHDVYEYGYQLYCDLSKEALERSERLYQYRQIARSSYKD